MDNKYIEALRNGKSIYDDSGNQYVWNEEEKTIKMYFYMDADAIISGTKNITLDQFKSIAETKRLVIQS